MRYVKGYIISNLILAFFGSSYFQPSFRTSPHMTWVTLFLHVFVHFSVFRLWQALPILKWRRRSCVASWCATSHMGADSMATAITPACDLKARFLDSLAFAAAASRNCVVTCVMNISPELALGYNIKLHNTWTLQSTMGIYVKFTMKVCVPWKWCDVITS